MSVQILLMYLVMDLHLHIGTRQSDPYFINKTQ
nr:MAG TPA: hypothetical protein [Caudoviricetes sp.]